MGKKCPPGVICIENITMGFIFIVLLILSYLLYVNLKNTIGTGYTPQTNNQKIVIENESRGNEFGSTLGFFSKPNYGYTNIPGDVLLNPYVPPLRDERYLVPQVEYYPRGSIPINVQTNIGAVDTSYRQVGILTPLNGTGSNGANKILALMGRPVNVSRDYWQYYTISDQTNSVKLPVVRNGKSCTNEYGCQKIYNGDSVYVEGYNQACTATIYDNDTIRYIPYI